MPAAPPQPSSRAGVIVVTNVTFPDAGPDGLVAATADVRIDDGVITAVAPAGALAGSEQCIEIEGSNLLLFPGLFNGAADTSLCACSGLLDNPDPAAALAAASAFQRTLTEDGERERAASAARNALGSGTTGLVDVVRSGPGAAGRAMARGEAFKAAGLRASIAIEIDAAALADDKRVAAIRDLVGQPAERSERVSFHLAVAAPSGLKGRMIEDALGRLANAAGDLHVFADDAPSLPSLDQMADRLESVASLMRERGGTVFVSGFNVSDPMIAAGLSAAGVRLVLTPESDLLLSRPHPDGQALVRGGADVLLGTGVISNGSLAMQAVLRLAAMAARPGLQSVSHWLTNQDVVGFSMKSAHGPARRIAVGEPADVVLYDRSSPIWTPLNNLIDQFVASETGRNAVVTIVAGRIVLDRRASP